MIRAGQLKSNIIIKQKQTVKNDYGESESTYVEVYKTRCEILSQSSNNGIVADGIERQKSLSLKLRYSPRLSADLFVEFDGEIYEIDSLENIKNREHLLDAIKYF